MLIASDAHYGVEGLMDGIGVFPGDEVSSDGHDVESFQAEGSCLRGLQSGGVDARYDRNGNGSFNSQSSSFFE